MKAKKVKGFNDKEQAIYELLAKDPSTPQSFADMKAMFGNQARAQLRKYDGDLHKDKKEVDAMAQSMARNGVRRLTRDGWAEQCARGTYRLTRTGKDRLKKGCDVTSSYGAKKGRPKKKKAVAKKATKPKKKKAAAKAKPKRKAAKAKAKTAAKPKAKRKAAKSSKGNGVNQKAKEARKRARKEAAKEDGQAAAKSAAARAAKAAQDEAAAN
jgi:hypothetical protein